MIHTAKQLKDKYEKLRRERLKVSVSEYRKNLIILALG